MGWIFFEPEVLPFDSHDQQPASYLRRPIDIRKKVQSAVLKMSALGVYIPYMDGQRLDGQQLLPGWTNYHKRVQFQEFDVTEYLTPGGHVLGAILGDGWYRGNVGAFNKRNVYGTKTALAAELSIIYEDGTKEELCGEKGWKASQDGPLRINDLKHVEQYDAMREKKDWCRPFFDDSSWHFCRRKDYRGEVVPCEGEKILEHEQFSPQILNTPDGGIVLDFGQNLAGHVKFTVTGPARHKIRLIMGEALNEKGNFTLANLQGEDKDEVALPVKQRLEYILKEGKQTYTPLFLVSGFRYVRLENWPEDVRAENFTAIAVYSDLCFKGTFACSNPLVNQLFSNIIWSMKSNFVDIPTDCPHRERAGWAGDLNVFMETADYLADTRKFIRKWMVDFRGSQKKNGALPYIIPEFPSMGAGESSAGWSDAIASVPLMQYWFYGDTDEAAAAFETVKKYVDYNVRRAKRKHPLHLLKRGVHYKYILDTGFHYGEWLEPGDSNIKSAVKAMFLPDAEVATAWFYYTTVNLTKMADILGRYTDQKKYESLASEIRLAYQKEFLPGGKVTEERQCKYIRPLYMGLAEEKDRPVLAEGLNRLCEKKQYKIGTGFLTTYQVLKVLCDNGYTETAYRMLEQEECPGWLYEVKQGATTIWEGWDAVKKNGKLNNLSMNHYAAGAVGAWLFSHCAGIRPLGPGFCEIRIQPVPGGSLSWAEAEYSSVNGTIHVRWDRRDRRFILQADFPKAICAEIVLPEGTIIRNAVPGTYECVLTQKC